MPERVHNGFQIDHKIAAQAMMAANQPRTGPNRVNQNRVNPNWIQGSNKIEMYWGRSLGVVVHAEFEFANENRFGGYLGVVLGELLIWVFLRFFNFSYFFIFLHISSFLLTFYSSELD